MHVLDLFSGIGGFSLGLERAGMRTVAFCERDAYCRAVLRKHWPSVPCFDDIHAIDADGLGRLGRIDLVCGGFPCQPFSVAGEQRAQADDRHLWPEMRRVIALARPSWVIGENVTGLIALALDDVLADLEAEGYTARTLVIPAVAVDAKHRRDRVWIIARNADDEGKSDGAVHAEVAELRRPAADAASLQWRAIERDESNRALQGNGDAANPDIKPPRWLAEPRRERCEWRSEPDVGRVAHGVPRRVDRLRCLGNAVVPQIVEEIGRAIMNQERA